MREKASILLKNRLLHLMLGGLMVYMAFVAVILSTLQVPPEAILDSGLKDILLVFEG